MNGRIVSPRHLVLCYHAVSPLWETPLAVSPAQLRRQVERLLSRGFAPTTPAGAVEADSRERVFAITFDDAYRSVLDHAAPVLHALGVTATVFVPTAYVSGSAPHSEAPQIRDAGCEAELRTLDWDELRQLASAGWQIGSHTHTHPHLRQISEQGIEDELATSRQLIERETGIDCRIVAYPYGQADDLIARVAKEVGYVHGFTLPARFERASPLLWPRVGIYRRDGGFRFAAKTGRHAQMVRGLRRAA